MPAAANDIDSRRPRPARSGAAALILLLTAGIAACGDGPPAAWAGSVDTLASGRVVVSNPEEGLWSEDGRWTLTEELRIGTADGDGADLFGRIESLAVDPAGRIYVLEGHAQEIRVFDAEGRHVRTVGRKGNGPGELARALQLEFGPEGNLWVADPENNRVSIFDTTGAYLEGHRLPGGFIMIPWPGRFDRDGRYYYPVPKPSETEFRLGLVRYDLPGLEAGDTLAVPENPVEPEFFEIRRGESVARASVPFSGGFRWQLSPEGTFWTLYTGDYRLVELSPDGDTLRTVVRAFEPLPVTDADMEQARENLSWFLDEGGEVDWSRIPSHKAAIEGMVEDGQGNLWVWPVTAAGEEGTRLDVFDPTGRYLGRITTPVPVAMYPRPLVLNGFMYAVTKSDLDVPFVVRLRVDQPSTAPPGAAAR